MTFTPFRLANGQVCCSDKDALCESCKAKHAARGHRSASTRQPDYTPVDPYSADAQKIRLANARAEATPDYPAIRKSSQIHLDANGNVDSYFADVEKMREEYARDRQ